MTTSGVIIVTGASRGIGRAVALKLAATGHTILVNYIANAAAAHEVVAQIKASGGRATSFAGDVAVEADILALFAEADRLGPLVGLVNNAGIVMPISRVDAYSAERVARMMAVNVTGSILCAREAVKRLSTRHGGLGGVIVNLSSIAARLGAPGEFVDYAASKGAIDSFTVGLAKEVAAEGIRVVAVRPGLIDTEIHASAGAPDRAQRMAATVPIPRVGTADEVADAVVWLMSDAARYVTGTFIDVTGGR
ncbi:MAG: SDR family oxidoreductase [Alphaproteobacteria bacterium]|jgi:NAD(P)-dependent dehydrogenase (short-subunit alcohol dehydrogenase family)